VLEVSADVIDFLSIRSVASFGRNGPSIGTLEGALGHAPCSEIGFVLRDHPPEDVLSSFDHQTVVVVQNEAEMVLFYQNRT
jgi:hypothetical protein